MQDKIFSNLEKFPDFLSCHDLVTLGLFINSEAAYLARLRGNSPDWLKLGRKILYPKQSIIDFIDRHMRQGDRSVNCSVISPQQNDN